MLKSMDEKMTVTGDHAENISVITRQQQRKNLQNALPKKTQEFLNINIRKYDGHNAKEAEGWLKDIEEWLTLNDLNLVSAFDLLLAEEAATLWKAYRSDETSKEDAKKWFSDTFMIQKSITEMIVELATVQQGENERFATFEIRVRD